MSAREGQMTFGDCFVRLWNRTDVKKLREKINELKGYDPHDILRGDKKIEQCEWHLNSDDNNNAIETAKQFHNDFEKLDLSSSIRHEINIIKQTFLEFKPGDATWDNIRKDFDEAYDKDNPEYIIRAYTREKTFCNHINQHSAVNINHTLGLYCTSLNCPVLAQTQEYIDAITKIFFHPKLNGKLVRKKTVYRGVHIDDEKPIANYKDDATIITTTFLSTSTDPAVADCFLSGAPVGSIKIFCIYNINNTYRRTAIDVKELSRYPDEEEILILRYIPFKIRSIHRMDNGRKMKICFDECQEDPADEENLVNNQLLESVSRFTRRYILRQNMTQTRFVSRRNTLIERF